jgi:hypothetical protein
MKTDIRLNKLHTIITLSWHDIQQYKLIFNDTPRRMEMLRNTANSFFYFYKEYFWRRMFTDISKITENAGKGKNKKLTISLYEELANKLELENKHQIIKNNCEIRKLSERFVTIRNKVTVHTDMKYAKGVLPLESDPDALNKVEKIYMLLMENAKVFMSVYEDLLPIGYVIGPEGDAQDLMKYLRKGYNVEQQTDPETSSG